MLLAASPGRRAGTDGPRSVRWIGPGLYLPILHGKKISASCANAGSLHGSLEIQWSDFDLNPFKRVVKPFPIIPCHTNTIGERASWLIQAIQIGSVAFTVPPGSVTYTGAVSE